jgi:hypothetical protein
VGGQQQPSKRLVLLIKLHRSSWVIIAGACQAFCICMPTVGCIASAPGKCTSNTYIVLPDSYAVDPGRITHCQLRPSLSLLAVYMMCHTGDLHRRVSHLCAAGGTRAGKALTIKYNNGRVYGSVRVSLPTTCAAAVHGCQLVMIRAAAPNLLQIRAGVSTCALPCCWSRPGRVTGDRRCAH